MKNILMNKSTLWVLIFLMGGWGMSVNAEEETVDPVNSYAVKAGKAHLGNGQTIENALIVIRDGRIESVTAGGSAPEGLAVLEVNEVTPGLIDANAKIDVMDALLYPTEDPRLSILRALGMEDQYHGGDVCPCGTVCPAVTLHRHDESCLFCGYPEHDPHAHAHDEEEEDELFELEKQAMAAGVPGESGLVTDQSSEVVPQFEIMDGIDHGSKDFDRLLKEGVTTVYISPDGSAVIGSRGATMRTGGPVTDRFMGTGSVKTVVGSDAYRYGTRNRSPFRGFVSIYTRRPDSRMGVGWVFRRAFYDALLRARGLEPTGADKTSAEASKVLQGVLAGEVPMRIQARTGSDIETAFRFAKEFGITFTLEDPVEAWKRVDLLKKTETPVVFGPIFDQPSGITAGSSEMRNRRLHTVRDLSNAGIPMALSAQDLRGEEGLARQAMLAIRYGVEPAEALRMVTQYPAELLGIEKEVGTLEPGRRADLVFWNGSPFSALTRIEKVMLDGVLSYEKN
ncbi:hypothetical protein CBD41_03865 [bacterium TMED181]|nr:hypothetical protein [Planctomycetota bacterium]OUW45513.1 MAG: hypothetical protein CBD41_03865 [bacterium TMED181]